LITALAAALSLSAGGVSAAPAETPWVRVDAIIGGWTSAGLRVQTTGAFFNPATCPIADGYFVDPTMPGAELFWSMLLTAQATNVEIQLTVDGCIYSRPNVIGVALRRP
jgi:hypothetical protein